MLTRSDMQSRRLLPLLVSLALLLGWPAASRADFGTFAVSAGATQLAEDGVSGWHPMVRAELSFRAVGPLELGGYLRGTARELLFTGPAFGGGLSAQLRAQRPVLGLVPHLEASAGRIQLPHRRQGRADAWETTLGGGLGVELDTDVVLEVRLHRHWYHGLDDSLDVSSDAWSLSLALAL